MIGCAGMELAFSSQTLFDRFYQIFPSNIVQCIFNLKAKYLNSQAETS
jgi:hypothetical protein